MNSDENLRAVEAQRAPTVDRSGKRIWIYPDRRPGKIASIRKKLSWLLILVYVALPWMSWNQHPLFRLDVQSRKTFVFGYLFDISDASYLLFILLIAAFVLFLVTALFGRLWCGYGCPQTVFVEWVIRPLEELIEGSAHHRRKIDAAPWTFATYLRKGLKHFCFLLVAVGVANVFLGYFTDPSNVFHWASSPPADHPVAFGIMLFVTGAFYFDLAWFREQFCSFLCPYARFQSVLMDADSPAVTYDHLRGEPRGRKGVKGDCIDCELCVRVCPTGIDIRKGLQLECIMCGRCADACNLIMKSLDRPPDLIKRASQNRIQKLPERVLRPRVALYAGLLGVTLGLFALSIGRRKGLEIVITRSPGTSISYLPDGRLGNIFSLHISNRTSEKVPLTMIPIAPAGVEIICGACANGISAESDVTLPIVVVVPAGLVGSQQFKAAINSLEFEISAPLILPDAPVK